MVELRKGVSMNRKRYGFEICKKRHGNMDFYTKASTKRKRKNRVRVK